MTKDKAIELFESKWWTGLSAKEIVRFQANEERLCMPFDLFHGAVEEVLDDAVTFVSFIDEQFMEDLRNLVK